MNADAVVAHFGLQEHPEGGWYRETFRDAPAADGRERAAHILYLLKAGERSRWHRIDATEIWHFSLGGPLLLSIAPRGGAVRSVTLGGDLQHGHLPHAVVPAGAWQAARPLGSFTLVGCTTVPAFRFDGFELAPAGWEPGPA